jgi:hypothetical protein
VQLVRTTSRCWPTEAFGSAIGIGGIMRAEVLSSGAASSDGAFLSPPLQPQLPQPPQQFDEQPQLGSQQQLASQQPQQLLRWNRPHRPPSRQQPWWPQPQLEQQPLSQPHEGSQQQDDSQPQLASQQPQPPWPRNMPHRPSNRQQWRLQQQLSQQLLLQPHEGSQQQDDSQPHEDSQPQLASQQPQPPWPRKQLIKRSSTQQPPPPQHVEQQLLSQQHDGSSQQQDFSQQPQLASQQHPQPPPSIRSSKPQPANEGLARAMLNMSAPKKFHFIEHRLLIVEVPPSGICADFRQRAMPPHAGLVIRSCRRMLFLLRADFSDRRKGHLKVPGVGIRRDVLGGFPR